MNASEVKGLSFPSMVREQPLGLEQTQHGATNRMWGLLDAVKEKASLAEYDFAVSIESGVVKGLAGEEMETWFEMAVVIVRDLKTGVEAKATSAGVQVAATAIGQWLEDGEEGTVGEIIVEELGGDKQDPHSTLTKNAFPRVALLEHAIRVAASQLSVAAIQGAPTQGVSASDD